MTEVCMFSNHLNLSLRDGCGDAKLLKNTNIGTMSATFLLLYIEENILV